MSSAGRADDTLARCIGDVAVFETTHWGRTPLLCRRDRAGHTPDTFSDVFTTVDLDTFLASGIRRPLVRVVQDGSPLPGEHYTTRARLGGTDFRDVVEPARVAELFAAGATVVAQSLHRTHSKVREFAEHLGDEMSHPIQANAYLTPPNARGLAPHADGHDVIVIQLEGSKHWRVDTLGEFELRAGDTLYVPAGREHAATSNHQTSLHLTLGILRVTYRSVLDRILRDGPAILDDPLPLRYRTGGANMETELNAMLEEVQRHLASTDAAAVGRAERSRSSRRPPRPGALTAAIDLADLDRDTPVARRAALWTVTRPTDSTVRVVADRRWLDAPASCAGAIAQIEQQPSVAIREFTGLDEASQLILARRLVASGFCRIVV